MLPIAITVGEPTGIGPDILIKLATRHRFAHPIVLLANRDLLQERAKQLDENLNLSDFNPEKSAAFSLINCDKDVIAVLEKAVSGCVSKQFSAMVTAPVNKALINERGINFSGHTEYLAALTNTPQAVMLFVYGNLRLALLTTHIPLSQVSTALTREKLIANLRVLRDGLIERFGIIHPKIVVTGLNPHAGEQGHLGKEEQTVIIPTLEALRRQGFDLIGPIPADTALQAAEKYNADAIASMYHDQLLPAIKALGFGRVVNVTLGLPIIRTSVDHGTAIELAGTGKADESSLVSATELAIQLIPPLC